MSLRKRLRVDLGQANVAIEPNEGPFLAASAVLIAAAAQLSDPGTIGDFALIVLAGLALVGVGFARYPPNEVAAAAVIIPVTVAIAHEGNLEAAFFLVSIMTLYSAWHLGSTVRATLVAAMATLGLAWVTATVPDNFAWTPWVAAEIFTLILGRNLARQRTLIDQLEGARTALADQAVAEERRRIARELHDLAGHTLAAVLLHVTGARHVLRRDLDEADRALVDAETVGRASMDQIRATVAALRSTETGTDVALPEGDQLEALVTEYRRAGLTVEADIAPGVAELGGPVAIALHRIGREALANVARHASGNHVEIRAGFASEPDRLVLEVSDRGRRAREPDPNGGRYGLVGMRERARALGGTFVAEPTDDGWRIEAVLPLVRIASSADSTGDPSVEAAASPGTDPVPGTGSASGSTNP